MKRYLVFGLVINSFLTLKSEILSDIHHIKINGKKLNNISFSFIREMKIAVINEDDLNYISKITLPTNYDKSYRFHTAEVRNIGQYYSGIKVNNFNAYRIKNGSSISIEYTSAEIKIRSLLQEQERFGTFVEVQYTNEQIQIGDTVKLEYSYSLPFNDNIAVLTNYRIFFNDVIDKKYFELQISYDKDLLIPIKKINLSNLEEKSSTDLDIISHLWKEEDLKGCISEAQSIPYKSLPHVVLSCVPYAFYYLLPNTTQSVPQPLYSIATINREAPFLSIIQCIKIGNKSKQYLQIEKFIEEYTSDIKNDTTGVEKLAALHNTIVKEFDYYNDIDHYNGNDDRRNERIGDFLSKKVFRDKSRYNLYVALIKSLRLNYFTGYIVDRRSAALTNDYIFPMFKDDFLIIPILADNTVRFILPKKDGLSYFLDELPFYYENTKIRLVHVSDYLNKDKPISEKFNSIPTPRSSLKDNIRNHHVMVNVNTETGTSEFDLKVRLGGQFSTLTRGVYQSKGKDNTINPLYNITLWDRIGAKSTMIKQTKSESLFPYKADFHVSFRKENALVIKDDHIEISLSGYFHHIITEGLDKGRVQPYHSDFLFYDFFNYFIKFDTPINLNNPYSKSIENKHGKFKAELSQVAPDVIKVSSLYSVNNDIIQAKDIEHVIEITNEIEMLNDYKLQLTK